MLPQTVYEHNLIKNKMFFMFFRSDCWFLNSVSVQHVHLGTFIPVIQR